MHNYYSYFYPENYATFKIFLKVLLIKMKGGVNQSII